MFGDSKWERTACPGNRANSEERVTKKQTRLLVSSLGHVDPAVPELSRDFFFKLTLVRIRFP